MPRLPRSRGLSVDALRDVPAEAGVGELVCWMNFGGLPSEQVRRSMRLFADEVMPAFARAPLATDRPAE